MPEEINDADTVGSVSATRYAEIVADLRKQLETAGRIQFAVGDCALEVEPMREFGGQERSDSLFTVKDSLFRLSEDIGLSYATVDKARRTASRWPKDRRVSGVSFTVHQILASIADDEERFATILTLPEGKSRWTPDQANRRVGRQVVKPVTPQEKVSAIHTLATDEEVAATVTSDLLRRPTVVAQVKQEDKVRVVEELTRDDHVAAKVTTGLLRRPDVAFRAMSDDTARHQVNHAQVERGRQAREHFEDTSPIAPAVKNMDRTVEFLDLVTACHAFVAAADRVVPGMRDRQLGDDERVIMHENVARVRATLDWIETAVDTGKVDVDGELAKLLQGE
ncbi:DUF6192 family protein [Streptomyces sp. NPDC088910]|uniref:DUF6192 family protein n=1 Tax=Streptomyces sp. NPDC088910 TaxID=3365911 RepID=UPI0038213BE7